MMEQWSDGRISLVIPSEVEGSRCASFKVTSGVPSALLGMT